MAEPATLPGDEPNTIRSGGHEGKVAVQNPLTGEIALVEPDDASHRVYSMGWQPVSQADATRADAHQLLKESITPGESIGLGLARGVSGGLVDLAPQGEGLRRATQATDEAFPWLTPIAEGAGFLSPLGVGAGLSAGGEAITGALRGGQELGLLGKAATRAAGMGAEGSVYGGIGAARQSQIEDTPLTAQKLLSGMFGGAIVGGGLGAGVGAAEGAGSLIRGMFKSSGGAREELNAPGLRDSDISPILERNGQAPLEPGALQKLQALLYNDPNITPELMAAASASKGIKDDMMFAAGPQRAAAEARFAEALNDLHGGNQAALDGWAGSLKRDKVASWIGPDSEHVSDAGNLVAHLESLDLPARNDLAEQIANAVAAQGKKNPEAFGELMNSMSATRKEDVVLNLRRALLHGDKDVLNHLFESKLLNDANITKLDIAAPKLAVNVDAQRFQEGMRPESFEYLKQQRVGASAGVSSDELHNADRYDYSVGGSQDTIRSKDGAKIQITRGEDAQGGATAEINGFDVSRKGQGTGKKRLAALLGALEDDGVVRVNLRANEDGRYFWARSGMPLSNPGKFNAVVEAFAREYPDAAIPGSMQELASSPEGKAFLLGKNGPVLDYSVKVGSPEWQAMRGGLPAPTRAAGLGKPRIEVYPDGMSVADGRHRMVLAAERGESEITANVVHYDADARVVSQGEEQVSLKRGGPQAPAVELGGQEPQGQGLAALLRSSQGKSALEPAWQTAALDYVDKQAGYLRELEAQPKGYVAGKGKGGIKNLRELMEGAAKSIKEGDRANAFMELDMVKKRLAVARGAAGPRIPADEAVAGIAGNMHEEARRLLEDPAVWGTKAASAQRDMNAILHERFTRNNDFYKAFYTGAGTVDPTNDWAEKLVADPAKIRGAMDRLGNPERSLELQQFKTHIAESNKLADIMEKYYSPDGAMKKQIADMRAGTVKANNAMDDALHFALRENQGKILSGVAHGGARGMASSIAAYALGGPLGLAGAAAGRALMNPGRIWRMQAIVERMVGSHGGRFAEGMAGLVGKAGAAAKASTRVAGSAAMLTQDVVSRQKAYHETLQDLAAMASNRDMVVKALASWHGPDFAHLPQSIPAMAESIMRGAQFALQCAPARPQPGIFSDDELGLLSDSEAEEWSNTVHAAMDPVAVLGFIKHGQLTPQVLKAAEVASPELVAEMRDQAAQLLSGTDRSVPISPVHQAGLTMLLGITPNPTYLFALQESWKANAQPTKKISVGNMGDTGVNERYSKSTYSAADRLESGEHQL